MKKSPNNPSPAQVGNEEKNDLHEYPLYPDKEDIYNKYREEKELDPEDISRIKMTSPDYAAGLDIDAEFNEDMTGGDLDIPGSEPDDQQENAGSEDEENNYYSLGGDDNSKLDEDKDDM